MRVRLMPDFAFLFPCSLILLRSFLAYLAFYFQPSSFVLSSSSVPPPPHPLLAHSLPLVILPSVHSSVRLSLRTCREWMGLVLKSRFLHKCWPAWFEGTESSFGPLLLAARAPRSSPSVLTLTASPNSSTPRPASSSLKLPLPSAPMLCWVCC